MNATTTSNTTCSRTPLTDTILELADEHYVERFLIRYEILEKYEVRFILSDNFESTVCSGSKSFDDYSDAKKFYKLLEKLFKGRVYIHPGRDTGDFFNFN